MTSHAGTTVDYTSIPNRDLVKSFAEMNGQIAANAPPGFDVTEWNALVTELVNRVPGISAEEFGLGSR